MKWINYHWYIITTGTCKLTNDDITHSTVQCPPLVLHRYSGDNNTALHLRLTAKQAHVYTCVYVYTCIHVTTCYTILMWYNRSQGLGIQGLNHLLKSIPDHSLHTVYRVYYYYTEVVSIQITVK